MFEIDKIDEEATVKALQKKLGHGIILISQDIVRKNN